jgi:1,4-dihydroxy-2-naphthoate octaprenyltransferase
MFRLIRPIPLLLAALTYSLGASIADYLGNILRPGPLWLGLLSVLLAQFAMSLLPEVFRLDVEPLLKGETRHERQILRNNILYTSVAALASLALIFYALFASSQLPGPSFLFPGLSLAIILLQAIPPFRLANRGFGELMNAIHIAYIIPSIAFVFQAGDEPHRFLALTIPLTLLAFTYFIAMNFPSFAVDRKYNRLTFLTRLGWERVVPLHHLFSFACFSHLCRVSRFRSFLFASLARFPHTSLRPFSDISTPQYFTWSQAKLDSPRRHRPLRLRTHDLLSEPDLLASLDL